jgi:TolA-binding protein
MNMSRSLLRHVPLALVVLALLAPPAVAANKEHQQMMADIRMLQEQQQRLQLQLAAMLDALKTVATKLDDAAGTSRKAFADEKLLIDNIAGDLRVVREKADDNNVRLGSLSQDVDAIHQSLLQAPAPGAAAGAPPAGGGVPVAPPTGAGAAPGAPQPLPAPSGGQMGVLPSQLFQQALSDYRSATSPSQWDLAIAGFERYLAAYPKATDAPDAQTYIGDSNRLAGKFSEAIAAYTKVINNYPSSNKVPEAYYRRGQTYEAAGDKVRAKQDYDYLIKTYPPDNNYVLLAKQRIQGDDEPRE